ncbi:MAG: 3-isopropylmalate dehydratase small subunit [Spirochaetaceae bacterium]|jgi:3-isopropylmalate/(R)-2-methylmalate dehydratase small subunit|nr:3-isopropylmalate dehydratase small subunit [Spirochaetaceae bacterium]
MKIFEGKVLFLDRADINTDEIIPARYLTEMSKQTLKPHLLEDLTLPGFNRNDAAGAGVVIARENFGCGSSREHAPWALEVNGIHAVIAPSFARIFRQNMFNGGLLAAELKETDVDDMFKTFAALPTECKITVNNDGSAKAKLIAGSLSKSYLFTLGGFELTLVVNEGWIGYADKKY